MKLNNKELYLLIADTITAVKNDNETPSIDELVEVLQIKSEVQTLSTMQDHYTTKTSLI